MSKAFFDNFFPAVSMWLQGSAYSEWLYRWSFPDETADLCPEPIVAMILPFLGRRRMEASDAATATTTSSSMMITIRNPMLCCHAVMGVWIGTYGAQRILQLRRHRTCATSPPPPHQHPGNNHQTVEKVEDDKEKNARHLWAAAFVAFSAMNVVSIPLHCLLMVPPPVEHDYVGRPVVHTQLYSWLWALDTFFTGAASVAITLTTLTDTCTMKDWTLVVHTIGVMGLYTYLQFGMTLPLELWYLIPTTCLAVPLTLLWLFLLQTSSARQAAVRLVAIGTATTAGVLLDPWFCTTATSWSSSSAAAALAQPYYYPRPGWDLFTSPALVFMGSNLAFATLLSYHTIAAMDKEGVAKPTTASIPTDSSTKKKNA